ncbi:MAG TPA: prealbumin-like fold domain-containing protein [Candidatus Mediterraneibacter pullistercoris]|nr:prealbumin-like fold domain-containing protein [Candidatus Mediterraneibacter pullistercoris]
MNENAGKIGVLGMIFGKRRKKKKEAESIVLFRQIIRTDGSGGMPEKGAQFQIYRKDAGSYEMAQPSDRDTVVCDEEGCARSRSLSEGIYVVHQVKGREDVQWTKDIEVELGHTGKTHMIPVYSAMQEYFVKAVRKDAETGCVIPLSDGAFRITDAEDTPYTAAVTYPEPERLASFTPNEKGYFITPGRLQYGVYRISEEKAPYGYAKNTGEESFDVAEKNTVIQNGITLVEVEMKNKPQKGRLHLKKQGPLSGGIHREKNKTADRIGVSAGTGYVYRPYFKEASGAGAAYDIIAAEDIVTPDGTLRMRKGDTAETIVTSEDGSALSSELYLGRYEVREKKAPFGLVLCEKPEIFELTYDESGCEITQTELEFGGERQKCFIHVKKILNEDSIFGVGSNGEIKDFSFGLFAASDIAMPDGSVIPEDGLVEAAFCGADGEICFGGDLPFGKYYVKELRANSRYRRSNVIYPVEFTYQDQESGSVHLYINDGAPLVSEMIRGSLHGIAADHHNCPAAGAQIGLFRVETEEFTGENSILISEADQNGAFSFSEIPCGDYIIRETGVPQGYIINEAVHYISLTFDRQRIDLKIISRREG